MWPEYAKIFSIASIGMAVLTLVWFFFESRLPRYKIKYLGVGGTALAAVIVAGVWLFEAFPWIWVIPQLAMLLWLMTFVLMGVGVALAFRFKGGDRWLLVIVGLLAMGMNAFSLLAFLWMAIMSPGGV